MPPKKKGSAPPAAASTSARATRSRTQKAAPADSDAASQTRDGAVSSKPARGTKKVADAATTAADSVQTTQSDDESEPTKPARGRKRAVSPAAGVDAPQPAAKKTKASTSTPEAPTAKNPESIQQQSPELEDAQVAKPGVKIPLDENIAGELAQYEVYIDDDGIIYDASLNQTNAGHNNNKFYRIQLLRNVVGDYKTWTRWGRVGDRGMKAILGDGSLQVALSSFNKKFKEKSGLNWQDRNEQPKGKKYTFVERSYAPESDDDDPSSKVKTEDSTEAPDSKLAPAVQELMELIFNQQYFQNVMSAMNYDVQKLPLGKLSKTTLTRGYQALKDLSALLNDRSLATTLYGTSFEDATENLSNSYFSYIPHIFGRRAPPIIRDETMLKQEIELLESLSDMKDADAILKPEQKDTERLNILDRQFQGLGMEEMTPLKHTSTEFQELKSYLMDTRGSTHNANYQIDQIFRIERSGEKGRFDNSAFAGPPRDRRLLWHGSRCTNFGGILSQGLRIAPPEAPVSGYMFGKGIYLADMSSKSANYCCAYQTNGHALLLLCEAELGNPMQILTNASYEAGDDAKAKGMLSTWGQGTTGPKQWKDADCVNPSLKGIKMPDTKVKPGTTDVPNANLLYNEYIAYDVAQVRLRYLFRVRM
ncbi:putative Poly polymerase catalytic domain-containing protein [Seiridium unicorne]|uniref:Poly [ADP-ribose] polymerase n=1 Tax=Seiridium unicorne TaxID=138068 RepID=A0ABR2UUG8_9PEZI